MNTEIIKYYTEELNELLRFHKTKDIYDIAHVKDRTQAEAYKQFLDKLNEPTTETDTSEKETELIPDVRSLLIAFSEFIAKNELNTTGNWIEHHVDNYLSNL